MPKTTNASAKTTTSATPQSERLGRLAAAATLHAEDDMRGRLREAADRADAEARKASTRRRAAALAAILIVGRKLARDAATAIEEGRDAARALARQRLQAELNAAGITGVTARAASTAEDGAMAASAAQSLASAWQAVAMARLARGRANGGHMVARVARTARTETAAAYNSEHVASLRADTRLLRRVKASGVVRQWSSIRDRGTCDRCAGLHDETVDVDAEFADGDPPLHVNCACAVILVSKASLLAEVA